jgi:adenosylhomocysteinase
MDMSFANQALCAGWVAQRETALPPGVHPVPKEIDEQVAHLKLASLGVKIDHLTQEQEQYLSSWEQGT